jgi:Flp pilus assembly pilin Flp
MMKILFARLWNDDAGALLALEFLFMATILVIGIVVGLVNVRGAINAELSELANAILALSEGYTISGVSGCCASSDGSMAIDTPGAVTSPTCVAPSNFSIIDVLPCS